MFKSFQFLGYMGGVPTRYSDTTSAVLDSSKFSVLIDAGENTFRNLLKSGYKIQKVKYIFITHMHPDHIGGLIPFLFYKKVLRIDTPLILIGPARLQDYIQSSFEFSQSFPDYDIQFINIQNHSEIYFSEGFKILSKPLDHSIPCYGYRFEHNRNSFVYITDTRITDNSYKLAKQSNILVHESTFPGSMEDLANEKFHATIHEAIHLADKGGVGRLILSHFSQRMKEKEYSNFTYNGFPCFISTNKITI